MKIILSPNQMADSRKLYPHQSEAMDLGFGPIRFLASKDEYFNELVEIFRTGHLPIESNVPERSLLIDRLEEQNLLSNYVEGIINQLLKINESNIYLNASLLLSPQGVTTLICGDSFAGKTTLTLGLLLSGWKCISEDLIFWQPRTMELIPYRRPFSLRIGSLEMLSDVTTNARELRIIDKRWVIKSDLFANLSSITSTDRVILLSPVTEQTASFSAFSMSSEEMIKLLLPLSNCLRRKNGITCLFQFIQKAECVQLTGSSLSERLRFALT